MNIDKLVYTKDNINQNNLKKKILFSYAVIFAVLFVISLTSFVLFFMRAKKDVLSFVLCCFLIIASVLYLISNILTMKRLKTLNNTITIMGNYEVQLRSQIKVDSNKKLSSTVIMFLVCTAIILVATICCVVFLCLSFTLEMLVEVLFMVLILCYTSQALFTSIVDDKIYKSQLDIKEINPKSLNKNNKNKETK